MATPDVETWKNVAQGLTGLIRLDPTGREIGRTVRGGEVFTITTFERQINQHRAASPDKDSFRNGRLVLLRASSETQESEIESPESMTDAEILDLLRQALNEDNRDRVMNRILRIKSETTLNRILEQLILDDDLSFMVKKVEEHKVSLNPDAPVNRGDTPRTKPKDRMGKAVGIQ